MQEMSSYVLKGPSGSLLPVHQFGRCRIGPPQLPSQRNDVPTLDLPRNAVHLGDGDHDSVVALPASRAYGSGPSEVVRLVLSAEWPTTMRPRR
jgi:hypothetical protein